MIIADLNKIEGRRYPARRRTPKPRGRRVSDSSEELLHRQRHARPAGRPSTVAQSGAGRDLLCRRRDRRDVPRRGTTHRHRRAGGLHSAGRFSPTHQHRRHAVANDLLLWAGRRRGALATGIGRHAPESRRRSAAAAGGRPAAMHRTQPNEPSKPEYESQNQHMDTIITKSASS